MADINEAVVRGNLVRDTEVRTTRSGRSVVNFTVAVNDSFRKGDEERRHTEYIKVTAWGGLAEKAGEYGKKGTRVRVEGKLRANPWTDKDGKKRTDWGIMAETIKWYGDMSRDYTESVESHATAEETGHNEDVPPF